MKCEEREVMIVQRVEVIAPPNIVDENLACICVRW